MSWSTRQDDWDTVDGTPRWVWRADEEFSRMPRVYTQSDYADRAQELVARVEDLRECYFPDWTPSRFQQWLGPRLEDCRQVRNLTTNPMDGSTPARAG